MSNNIHLKMSTQAEQANASLKKLNDSAKGLSSSMTKAGNSYGKFMNNMKSHNNQFSNMTRDINRSADAFSRLKRLAGAGLTANFFANAIQSAMNMNETINLFEVSMGDFAETTQKAVVQINKLTGVDTTNLQNRIGTFSLLARSMGASNEMATKLSTNVNQLTFDLSSLTDVPIAQVARDLQSGLLGQSETMYKYGVDVTEMSLKTEALANGITKSVRQMTQGEKMILRYMVMLRQSGLAHGDFANTINQPSNQLKLLGERFTTLTRTIGSLFIPMLNKVLPYINAFVIVLTRLFQLLGAKIGFEMPTITNRPSGIGGMAEDAEELDSNLGGATNKAKKLKQALAGFDEINVLGTKDSDSGGSGGGGADLGGGSPFDLELPSYDAMLSTIRDKANDIADTMIEKLKIILRLATIIGGLFLGWKLGNILLDLATIPRALSGLAGVLGGIGQKLGIIGANGKLASGIPLFATTAIIVARLIDLLLHSENFRKGLSGILTVLKDIASFVGGALKTAFGDAFTNFAKAFESVKLTETFKELQWWVKVLDLDLGDLGVTLAGIGLLLAGFTPYGAVLLAFEAITLAVRGIGYALGDVVDEFDLFEGVSKDTKTKLEPILAIFDDLSETLSNVEYGNLKVSDEIVEQVKSQLSEITTAIKKELDADQNEALKTLAPLKYALGEEAYNDLVIKNQEYYKNIWKKTEDGEREILRILEEAKKNGGNLTQEQADRINQIQEEMTKTAIINMSEYEEDYIKIMATLESNSTRISAEQASNIIKRAIETKDSTIASANEQYEKVMLEAEKMRLTGQINDEEYEKIKKSAEEARDATIADAETQFNTILKKVETTMPEIFKIIDTTTGDIKTKWNAWLDDTKKYASERWQETKDRIVGYIEDIGKAIDWLINKYKEMEKNAQIGNKFSDSGKSTKTNNSGGSRMVQGAFGDIPQLARGGSISAGQFFEAGESGRAELIGSYKGKTTVMPLENSGFVEAVAGAVQSAVANVMVNNESGVVVNIGDRTLIDTIQDGMNRKTRINGKTAYYL